MAKDEYTLELFLTWYSFNQTVALCEPANQPVSGGTLLHFLFKVKWEYFKRFFQWSSETAACPLYFLLL